VSCGTRARTNQGGQDINTTFVKQRSVKGVPESSLFLNVGIKGSFGGVGGRVVNSNEKIFQIYGISYVTVHSEASFKEIFLSL
jgi:hypothetical protein